MFCGRASHLDEFCFRQKRIERRHVEYDRDSYRDEFIDFPPRSYSRVLLRFYSCALTRNFSRASPQFAHGPNHCLYGFGPRESRFEPRCFGYVSLLIVVIVSRVGLVFPLEGPSPTLSRDTWTIHIFSVVVHVLVGQVVRCKGL
jgi:hypothetical protein